MRSTLAMVMLAMFCGSASADDQMLDLVKNGHAIQVPANQAGSFLDSGYEIESLDARVKREAAEHERARSDERNRDMLIGGGVAVVIGGVVLLLRRRNGTPKRE